MLIVSAPMERNSSAVVMIANVVGTGDVCSRFFDIYLPGSQATMLLPNLTFMLLIIIEGCAGPTSSAGCGAKNFSIRIPYEKLEQCEAARRGMIAGGAQQYVVGLCLAIPKDQKGP